MSDKPTNSLLAALLNRAVAETAQVSPLLAKVMRGAVVEYNAEMARINGR